jgi:FlaA1/EpsC-like NDP-sugar epimerase
VANNSGYQIPRATLLIDWGVTVLLAGGLRSSWRLMREHGWLRLSNDGRRRALMIGADCGGDALIKQIHGSPQAEYCIIGFLDENNSHFGSRLGGIPFLGTPAQAIMLAEKYRVSDLLVIARSLSGDRLSELMKECRSAGIAIKIIPAIDDLLSGQFDSQLHSCKHVHGELRLTLLSTG